MIVVCFCGSQKKQATDYILKETLRMLKEQDFETRFFTVRRKRIGFCLQCDYCLAHKGCVQKDDMEEIYTLLKDAKGIIIATPVYNGGISAQTKTIMEQSRAAVAADKNFFKYKVG